MALIQAGETLSILLVKYARNRVAPIPALKLRTAAKSYQVQFFALIIGPAKKSPSPQIIIYPIP